MEKIIGIICLLVGAALILWGYNLAHSAGGQLGSAFIGSPGEKAIWRYTAGGVLCVLGLFQIIRKR